MLVMLKTIVSNDTNLITETQFVERDLVPTNYVYFTVDAGFDAYVEQSALDVWKQIEQDQNTVNVDK